VEQSNPTGNPEIGTTLANLRLTPQPLNSKVQDRVTFATLGYAAKLNGVGFLSAAGLNAVRAAAEAGDRVFPAGR
jgi:hypothetical protein